ncbi:hypothetical protein LTR85_001582 [Meristemomyces frigidus]|nr:hypothetical protein LTR85_001582 [Meristemomyces frigidus]
MSLSSQGAGSDSSPAADSKNTSTACDPGFQSQLLCSQDAVNVTSNGTSQSPHTERPGPGAYTAMDPFFMWQESNFIESEALRYYSNWSIGAHERRLSAQKGNVMDETRLFAYEHLGWAEFICGADKQHCGCPMDSNVLDEIIERIPNDADTARRVLFWMKMIYWANQLVCTLLNAGTEAQLAMYGKAGEFADIFFVKPDHAAEAECEKINAVISALIGAGLALSSRGPTVMEERFMKNKPAWDAKAIHATLWEKFVYNAANIAANNLRRGQFLALPEDERETNTARAMLDISTHMDLMNHLLAMRMTDLNEGIAPPEDLPQDAPSEMAFHLIKLFGMFIPEDRILTVIGSTSDIADTIEQFITDRLVEKAWRTMEGDEGFCSPTFMKTESISFCPDAATACQAACWRGVEDMANEPLYGYDDHRISSPTWNINLTNVVQGSYWEWYRNKTTYLDAYAKRSRIASLPELANARGVRLPVCVSDHTEIQDYTEKDDRLKHPNGQSFPCNCGNSWGDDNMPFYRTDTSWFGLQSSEGYSHLGDYVEMCRSQLQKPFGRQAAKFAVNMCTVAWRAYPQDNPGLPGYQQPDRTKEGRQVCGEIVKTVHHMREAGKSESEIDSFVCGVVNVHRGKTFEKGAKEGFQRVLHEIQDKCD